MLSPTKKQIKQIRMDAGFTQAQAAKLIYCSLGAWQKWEAGGRKMHPAFFELFLLKNWYKTDGSVGGLSQILDDNGCI